jgi:hypothetical protein
MELHLPRRFRPRFNACDSRENRESHQGRLSGGDSNLLLSVYAGIFTEQVRVNDCEP